jgi:hypothetical protein
VSFALIFTVAAIVVALWGYRAYTTGDTSFSFSWLFPARPEPRLGVSEQASVDRQRRLVLVRRDDVEHLIMTGGPVDVVIETGIAAPRQDYASARQDYAQTEHVERSEPPPLFGRKPRGFGQAVNE